MATPNSKSRRVNPKHIPAQSSTATQGKAKAKPLKTQLSTVHPSKRHPMGRKKKNTQKAMQKTGETMLSSHVNQRPSKSQAKPRKQQQTQESALPNRSENGPITHNHSRERARGREADGERRKQTTREKAIRLPYRESKANGGGVASVWAESLSRLTRAIHDQGSTFGPIIFPVHVWKAS